MAANGVDIAQAYVHLIPSMEGSERTMTDEIVGAADEAGDKAGKSSGKKFSGSLKKYLAGGAAVAGLVGAFKGLYGAGQTFDDLSETIRVGSGASGAALDGLVANAKNVGSRVPAEFDAIASTVADVSTRMGLTGETMETVASQYLEAGRILGEEVDIGKTSAAFNAFKIEGDGVSAGLDHLFQVSQATGIGMNELASQVSANAPTVQALGFGFEEASVMVGTFDKAGLNSSQMMSGMSRGLVNLAKDGEAPAEAFQRVVGELGGFIEKGDEAAALDLAGEVFGTRGASQFIGALESGALNLDDMTKAAGQTGDTILGLGEETADFSEQWQVFSNNAMLAIEPVASALFENLGGALQDVMPHIQALSGWMVDNQWVFGVIAGLIGVTLVAAFVSWTASVWASTIALLASPITWLVLLIGALVAAIIWVATQTTFFQDVWAAVWGAIKAAIAAAGDFIRSTLTNISNWWSSTWTVIKAAAAAVWAAIKSVVTSSINAVRSVVFSVLGAVSSWWRNTWAAIRAAAAAVWAGIVSLISGAINGVRSTITNVLNGIRSIWSNIWGGLSGAARSAWNGITGFFSGAVGRVSGIFGRIGSAIMSPFRNAFNSIAGFWNRSVGQISFTVPDWVPGVGGKGFSVPSIPMLASGGVVTQPTLAMVGEGAEHEAVLPLSKLNRMLETAAAGGGDGLTVNGPLVSLPGAVIDSDDRVKQLAQGLWDRADRSKRARGRSNSGGIDE
ncbi:phage tail tape measure protein [Glutamicibacter arilaitensis]